MFISFITQVQLLTKNYKVVGHFMFLEIFQVVSLQEQQTKVRYNLHNWVIDIVLRFLPFLCIRL